VALYLVVSGTAKQLATKYLSLTAPDASTATCSKIPVAVTGTFYADLDGAWSTSKAFDRHKSLYQLTMTGSSVSEEQYTSAMQSLSRRVQAFGANTTGLDIIGLQIALSLFRATEHTLVLQADAQLGQILATLDASYFYPYPVFLSAAGVCQTDMPTPTIDHKGLILTATFPYQPPPSTTPKQQPTTQARAPTPTPTPSSSTSSNSSDDGGGGNSLSNTKEAKILHASYAQT